MIVAAACVYRGIVYALPAPARHHDVIAYIGTKFELVGDPVHGGRDQGFIDSILGYVTRDVAAIRAIAKDQISPDKLHPNGQLYTEDLW